MKVYILIATLLLLTCVSSFSEARRSSGGSVHVRSYTTKRGTYVAPHNRTHADNTKSNNWSTRGNVNPYTGRKGYKKQ